MGSAFHQLCIRDNGALTPTAPTANRLWETFTWKMKLFQKGSTLKGTEFAPKGANSFLLA